MQFFTFLGLPGSGKGTQAKLLAKKLDAKIIGMGELIREEIEKGEDDPLCKEIKKRYKEGSPQRDEVISDLIHNKVHYLSQDMPDIIFDNYPFSKDQAHFYFDLAAKFSEKKPILVFVNISPDTSIRRIVHRKVCADCGAIYAGEDEMICEKCGGALEVRPDDNVETVEHRISVYKPRILEVTNIFKDRGIVLNIDGEGSIEEVCELIIDEVEKIHPVE